MKDKLHSKVKKAIKLLGEDLIREQKFITKYHIEKPFPISGKTKIDGKTVYNGIDYKPDATFITKQKRYWFFEILETEGINGMISDYLQASLLNAKAIIFICKPEDEKNYKEIFYVIVDKMFSKFGNVFYKASPDLEFIAIDPKNDEQIIKEEIRKQIKDRWKRSI